MAGYSFGLLICISVLATTLSSACAEDRLVEVTVEVEKEVIREVTVEVVKEVVREVEVPVTVESTVIHEIEVEVTREVVVTREVEKEVQVVVVATATPSASPTPVIAEELEPGSTVPVHNRGYNVIGDQNAPITVLDFSDFL